VARKRKNILQRYLAEIKRKYDTTLTEQNYIDMILEELESPPSLLDYFKAYMARHGDIITLKWGCLIFLFIKADEGKDVYAIEKYYNLLERYPLNWFTEVSMAELELKYYGNIFNAKDRFQRALELRPNDPHCYYNLGLIYHLLGVFDKSAEHYEKAVIYHENANMPRELKARSLFNIAVYKINIDRDYKEARKLLKDALREMPDYPQAEHALGQIRWSIR
jgi:tetratricopeptide (TPR) repeat protein